MTCYAAILKYVSCFTSGLLLLACSGTIAGKDFDKSRHATLKKIALLRIDEPTTFVVNAPSKTATAAHLGAAAAGGLAGFGILPMLGLSLAGAGAGHAIANRYSDDFQLALKEHEIQFAPALVASLRQELGRVGYNVDYLHDQSFRDSKERDYFSHITTDADAILVAGIGSVGYSALGKPKGLKPTLHLYVTLVESRTRDTIYQRLFYMTPVFGTVVGIEQVRPLDTHIFDSVESLLERIDDAAQGIKDGQHSIVVRIAEELS